MIDDNGRATQRIWRTTDGKFVGDGDPAAAFLAYAAGEEVIAGDRAKLTEAKAATPAADKAAAPPANKATAAPAGKSATGKA